MGQERVRAQSLINDCPFYSRSLSSGWVCGGAMRFLPLITASALRSIKSVPRIADRRSRGYLWDDLRYPFALCSLRIARAGGQTLCGWLVVDGATTEAGPLCARCPDNWSIMFVIMNVLRVHKPIGNLTKSFRRAARLWRQSDTAVQSGRELVLCTIRGDDGSGGHWEGAGSVK